MSRRAWASGVATGTGTAWCVIEDRDGLSRVPLAVGATPELARLAFEAVALASARASGDVASDGDEREFVEQLRGDSDRYSIVRCALRYACHVDERGDVAPPEHWLDGEGGTVIHVFSAAQDAAIERATALERWSWLTAEVNGRVVFGMPAVRDPEHPCSDFDPGDPSPIASCEGDGHWMCSECARLIVCRECGERLRDCEGHGEF